MKKFLAILLALTLTLGLAVTAFAADTTPSITVSNVGASTLLNVYKVMSSEKTSSGTYKYTFANDDYKNAFSSAITAYITAYNADESHTAKLPELTDTSAAGLLLYVTNNLKNNAEFSAALATALYAVAETDTAYKTQDDATFANGTMTFSPVDLGYYLVKDATSYEAGAQVALMLDAADPTAAITLKTTAYTKPNKVLTGDPASVHVGQNLPYTVTIAIPNYSKYTTATFTITDTMSKGLTYNNDMTATLDGAAYDITGKVTYSTDATTKVTTITLSFADIAAAFPGAIGKNLVLSYSATVNNEATVDGLGNAVVANENNHNVEGNTITKYTYGFSGLKNNEYGQALSGVEFKLYPTEADATADNNAINFTGTTGNYVYTTAAADGTTNTIVTGTDGKFQVFGLEIGNYYLKETQPLKGYNNLTAPIHVAITAESNKIQTLATIVNYTGVELPSTGGMGTTIFTICGMLILMTSGLFLALNRKRLFNK